MRNKHVKACGEYVWTTGSGQSAPQKNITIAGNGFLYLVCILQKIL
jgi:hypothetical protein